MSRVDVNDHISQNRYTDIIPNTLNMSTLDGKKYKKENYFNGNYIMDRDGKVNFIATQGPLEETTEDFWKMVILNDVKTIVGRRLIQNNFRNL